MCLIAVALESHPLYRLVLVANRDEFRDRPTDPAAFWEDAPQVLGGRDRRRGGTWLGVTRTGKLAAVTNYRDPGRHLANPPSRGLLVADYLRDDGMSAADLQTHLKEQGNRYDGFSLLYGTCSDLHFFSNRGGPCGPVPPGIHALSNHVLDTDWPKVVVARQRLEALLQEPRLEVEGLLGVLSDPHPFPPHLLPDTGVGPERERLLSSLFIPGEHYGTRSTTAILIDRQGEVTFVEQGHDLPLLPRRCFRFRLEGYPPHQGRQP